MGSPFLPSQQSSSTHLKKTSMQRHFETVFVKWYRTKFWKNFAWKCSLRSDLAIWGFNSQNGYNLVTWPPNKILRPLSTLQLLILPTGDPFHVPNVCIIQFLYMYYTKIKFTEHFLPIIRNRSILGNFWQYERGRTT